MVKIRLTRGGARSVRSTTSSSPTCAARATAATSSALVSTTRSPRAAKRIELDLARVDHWVKNGAQPTDKVRNLIKEATKSQAAAA